ncbi:peptidylprolyl isomerase [Fibrella rubiginis]|uniref:peptidylprolyl isomerase n=1 Tax=Fibrella rubiginis TaxID=2817060 RepID=UPI001E52FE12|nr:peptidylprolyl isomerase [Fibrella rubiginis]
MISPQKAVFFGPKLAAVALCVTLFSGCKTSAPVAVTAPPPPVAKPVVLTLGQNRTITSDEFFDSFTKNQLSSDTTQRTDLRGYLELYTNLKLKVLAAEQAGRDTTEAFREEMATYRKQLAQPYLTDKSQVEQLATEAYQRMQQEVNASHILIGVAEEALPADTLKAYQLAVDLRNRLLKGEAFNTLADQFSADPTARQNGGNLGWFTAFQMVYPVETAAYTTPVGTISTPVRSKFGYHLVRVNERRASRGKVQVAHILVRVSPSSTPNAPIEAKAKIDEAYAKLKAGESFDAVCRAYSDDVQSKNAGGKLPPFATGQVVPALEAAAFALPSPGSLSAPIQTNYGWHILKLIERKPMESFAELAPALRQKVVTDTRAEVLRQATLHRLSRDYPITEYAAVKQAVFATADSSLLQGKWKPAITGAASQPLFTIDGKTVPISAFLTYARQKQAPHREGAPAVAPSAVLEKLYTRFVGDQLLATEEANLERKYPEFRNLLAEVRDGVLLSQVMEEQVWERSMTDSVGQKAYYEAHRANYNYPERVAATVAVAQNKALLDQLQTRLAGNTPYALRRSAPELRYEKNQAILSTAARDQLFDVLVAMVKNPAYVLEVTGSREATEADSVSANRIRNVVKYLTTNGISLSRITEKDLRAFRPASAPASAGAAQLARRVTFTYASTDKMDLARVISGTATDALTLTEGLFAKGQNPYVDAVSWQVGTQTKTVGNRVAQVQISRIEPARPKTFTEARGAVINDYQAQLEKQLLATLREKYPVQVNENELKRLVK